MKASDISSRARSPAAPRSPRSADRFRLAGPTIRLDRRVHAVRRDIADIALAGHLFAPHYAAPQRCACAWPAVPLRAEPSDDARAVSELRLGDRFALLDHAGGWAWGYAEDDHYVGYLPAAALGPRSEPTHRVVARTAPVFAAADIKAPVLAQWPMGARFAATADGAFLATEAGLVHARHARPLHAREDDPVAVAERLLGTPYVWGGRSGAGIDCSGLIQLALALCGIPAPRDSDQQHVALGRPLAAGEAPRRGDLAFFPGHVGFLLDGERLIHANAHWMAVTVEALADVVARAGPATLHRLTP